MHAMFAAGDSEGVIGKFDTNIVHQGWAPTSDMPFMGVFTGIEEGKKFLEAVGSMVCSLLITNT